MLEGQVGGEGYWVEIGHGISYVALSVFYA